MSLQDGSTIGTQNFHDKKEKKESHCIKTNNIIYTKIKLKAIATWQVILTTTTDWKLVIQIKAVIGCMIALMHFWRDSAVNQSIATWTRDCWIERIRHILFHIYDLVGIGSTKEIVRKETHADVSIKTNYAEQGKAEQGGKKGKKGGKADLDLLLAKDPPKEMVN